MATLTFVEDLLKRCSHCREMIPMHEFCSDRKRPFGKNLWCTPCRARHYQENKQEHRAKALKSRFGITAEEYDEMLEAQGGACAICAESCVSGRRLAVDHDHETGRVRGLLCANCNRALGLLKDDAERLARAARYLGGQ